MSKMNKERYFEGFDEGDNITITSDFIEFRDELLEENKRLKEQNEFLMKQDNILQNLIHWLYETRDNLNNPSFLDPLQRDDAILKLSLKIVIDKIKEFKEEMK